MNRDELRAVQQPLKEQYKSTPEAASITLRATGTLGDNVTCNGGPANLGRAAHNNVPRSTTIPTEK
jgi:hypothetical protein